jgi:cytochrome c-type biogenesis protein CcmH/NrfG
MWALVRHMTPEAQSFIQRILAQAAGRTIEHVMEAVSLALGTAPAGAPACEGLPVAHRPWTWAAAVVGMLLLFGTGWHMMHRPSLPGTTGEALLNLARERYDAGDHAAVIALCQEFLAISKATNGPVRVLLGNAFYRTGRYRDAEVEYRAALQDEASSLHALYNLGLALYHQGREEEAAHVFEQFAEAYRTDYPELASRARIALSLIRRNPSSPEPTIH